MTSMPAEPANSAADETGGVSFGTVIFHAINLKEQDAWLLCMVQTMNPIIQLVS